jgi:hypothetical protein
MNNTRGKEEEEEEEEEEWGGFRARKKLGKDIFAQTLIKGLLAFARCCCCGCCEKKRE